VTVSYVGAVAHPGDAWRTAIWECSVDAIALSDPAGVVLAVNPAYQQLYGFTPEEVVGKSFTVIFPEGQRAAAEAQYREVFQAPAPPPVLHSMVRRKDGAERIVETRVSFVEDSGRRSAMLSIVRDVTDEVNARRAAAQAERELRAFLFSLSHDIKNPLAVIKGHAQVMRRQIIQRSAALPAERLTRGLTQIETSALRAADLIDELVELATHTDDEPMPLHRSPVDLVAICRDAVERHQHLTDAHHLDLQSALPTLVGVWDGPRLVRVLDNLLANAIKYSPQGGSITARLAICGAGALLAIEDCGIGIDDQDLAHVFDRFHRGVNVPHAVPGSGLGLTSVKQIVDQHGGTVTVENRAGGGATVSVWLPLEECREAMGARG